MTSSLPFLVGTHHQQAAEDGLQCGVLELFEPVDLAALLCGDSCSKTNAHAQSNHPPDTDTDADAPSELLCLATLPAHMIPAEILHFFAACLADIFSIRIFRHHARPERYLALLRLTSCAAAGRVRGEYGGQLLSSLDKSYCCLLPVRNVSFGAAGQGQGPRQQELGLGQGPPPGLTGSSAAEELGGFSVDTDSARAASVSAAGIAEEEESCPVCLEAIPSMSLTTCCGHRFHMRCTMKLEGPQCPVCRFQHDAQGTVCFVCGWAGRGEGGMGMGRGMGGGTGMGQDIGMGMSMSMGMDMGIDMGMGMGQEMGWGQDTHQLSSGVRSLLPAGATSTPDSGPGTEYGAEGNTGSGSVSGKGSGKGSRKGSVSDLEMELGALSSGMHSMDMGMGVGMGMGIDTDTEVDLWLCLICGFTGCGGPLGHMQEHYADTLHTYAMNLSSRLVWDFAGDGYVHRLILEVGAAQEAQGGSGTSGESGDSGESGNLVASAMDGSIVSGSGGSQKLVEVSPRDYQHHVRSTRPPLTSAQEQMLIARKLESAASRYNQLLAWQLAQNRMLYMSRLQRIRNSVDTGGGGGGGGETGSSAATKRPHKNWRQNVLASLRTEKSKLGRQLEAARARLTRGGKELDVLKSLHHNLLNNRAEWQTRVDAAAGNLAEAEKTYRCEVPLLEEKVRQLMKRLDAVTPTNTGAKPTSASMSGEG
ncbi:hypothetical protein B484DRAFT_456282 [Ochromonadaceae sp. CCMP2298]|nr:hypothetical protein B484DRAFT_456282 [Ochromonadaceae sp. CCMP2298]